MKIICQKYNKAIKLSDFKIMLQINIVKYQRMKRLTVSNLFNIQSPICLLNVGKLQNMFLTDNYLAISTNNSVLLYKIDGFDFVKTIDLQEFWQKFQFKHVSEISKVCQKNNRIVIMFSKINQLLVFDGSTNYYLKGHMDTINSVILLDQYVISASSDFTIRMWKDQKCEHILSLHSNNVTCLQLYYSLFISGSQDKKIILWDKNKSIGKIQLERKIISIKSCYQSDQLAVGDESGIISIIGMNIMVKGCKKIDFSLLRKISIEGIESIISICQIDDSFLGVSDGGYMYIVQLNLGFQVHKIRWNIISLQSIGKILIGAKKQQGLELLKLDN